MDEEGSIKTEDTQTVGRAYMTTFWPAPDFEGTTFHSSNFSTDGTFIYVMFQQH